MQVDNIGNFRFNNKNLLFVIIRNYGAENKREKYELV